MGDGSAPFSVATLPGLTVWLRGDVGIVDDLVQPGRVKRWLDQSGNDNDADEWNSDKPVHDPQALNGIDVVDFAFQGQLAVVDDPSLHIGTGPFAVVFVAKLASVQNPINFLSKDPDFLIAFGATPGYLNAYVGGGFGSLLIPAATDWQIFAVRGPALKLQINGTAMATGTTGTTSAGTGSSPLVLSPGNNVKVAELIFVKGALSDADLTKVEAYLKAKYAL